MACRSNHRPPGEEINFQPAGSPGGQNYGWDHQESGHCYPASVAECPRSQVGTLPVAEYKHGEDGCSITGIGVYRGEEFPSLDGIYFNSDWCSGKFWGLARGDDSAWIYQQLLDTGLLVTGSGSDEEGNLYATACACEFSRQYDPFENPQGTVWRIRCRKAPRRPRSMPRQRLRRRPLRRPAPRHPRRRQHTR